MAKYKAKIKSISKVDVNGLVEISYDIIIDETTTYSNLIFRGMPDYLETQIKSKMSELKENIEASEKIKVNSEIILD